MAAVDEENVLSLSCQRRLDRIPVEEIVALAGFVSGFLKCVGRQEVVVIALPSPILRRLSPWLRRMGIQASRASTSWTLPLRSFAFLLVTIQI